MASLCEGGNEPPGFLKAKRSYKVKVIVHLLALAHSELEKHQIEIDLYGLCYSLEAHPPVTSCLPMKEACRPGGAASLEEVMWCGKHRRSPAASQPSEYEHVTSSPSYLVDSVVGTPDGKPIREDKSDGEKIGSRQ
ncbi:hypothetical protein ANN_06841 [Periplaneta americana]|uniref:Uncharacterized protein n=1 Tax=Periplaneta americana TaxID=6978 RepID=A0ABQ8TGI8_PERAM|nr:hypothetical protein ANN_06841 [Periplaneta americana]